MGLFSAATLLIGAVAAVGSAISTGISNKRNRESTEKANAANLEFANKQFAYEQYLNQNQYQMNVADMEKAGINPLASFSPSVSSGSYQSNQQASQDTALDFSGITNLAGTVLQNQTQKKIAEDSNETAKSVAKSNNESAEKIASMQNATKQEELIQQGIIDTEKNTLERQKLRQEKTLKEKELAHKAQEDYFADSERVEKINQLRAQEERAKHQLELYEKQLETEKNQENRRFILSIVKMLNDDLVDVSTSLINLQGRGRR